MEIMSESTIKQLRNILAFAKDATLKEPTGQMAVGFANSFRYCLELSDAIEEELKKPKEEPVIKPKKTRQRKKVEDANK